MGRLGYEVRQINQKRVFEQQNMGVITVVTVENAEIELGRTLTAVDDLSLAFEKVVPTGSSGFRYLWAYTRRQEAFYRISADDPAVEAIKKVHVEDARGVYEVALDPDRGGFLSCLRESDLAILQAHGSLPRWKFELRFQNYEAVDNFQTLCQERDISLSVERVLTDCANNSSDETLTQAQRETIELALKWGYFEVPRRTTIVELAEELGVSDQAVSARIRRAMQELAQQFVGPDTTPNSDNIGVINSE